MKSFFRSKLVLSLAALVLIAAVIVIPLSGSISRSHAQAAPTITLKPTSGPPGTVVTVTGSGWTPGKVIDIRFGTSGPSSATPTAANDGTFSTTITIPSNAALGPLSISGDQAGVNALATFTVKSPTPPPPTELPGLFATHLKLNLLEHHEAPSAELKEEGKLNPTVLETFKVASCLAEFLPFAGKVLHVGTHTLKILNVIKKTVGRTTTVIGILQDVPTGNITVAEITIVGEIGLSLIPFESCGELFIDFFFQPLPPETIEPPIIPVPVPTPPPPTGIAR